MEVEPKDIEYQLPKSDGWDINKGGGVKIKNRPRFEKAVKEVHKKLAREVKSELFDRDKKESHSDTIEYNITESGGKWQINFFKKGATTLSSKVFSEDQIIIEPEYYEIKKITYPDGGEMTEEKPGGFQWSTG